MTIHLEFTAPYDGTVYSKSNGQTKRCIHIAPHSHIKEATFSIEYHSCGTRSDSQGKYYENTIIIQYDDDVIEAWDEAKKIRCEWHDGYEKSAFKMPITISDLDVVEMNFQGDDVDCWLEVQDGKGPWSAKVEGLVPLGSPLTLVVAIQDSEKQFDMRVKSCIAHDGHKHPIHLTDEDGCVLRPKMMSPFQKTSDTKGTASVIAYSHFYAFKFPETVEVTIQCTVEICRNGCPDTCTQGRDAHTSNPGETYIAAQGKDHDDIPTYKDTHAFSTVVTTKPGILNSSSASNLTINSYSNDTKSEETEPLKTSPDTHHGFYMDRYPYDMYDISEAEERNDRNEHELYTDIEENEYTDDNNKDIYFPQMLNVLTGGNEHGKNFPPDQKIQNVSVNEENNTDVSEFSTVEENTTLMEITEETTKPTQSLKTEEKIQNASEENEVQTESIAEISTPQVSSVLTENPVSEDLILIEESQLHAKNAQDHALNQLFSSELFEEDPSDTLAAGTKEELEQESNHPKIKTESLHESNIMPIYKSGNYNDRDFEDEKEIGSYKFGEKRMIIVDDSKNKNLVDKSFENFKMKPRTPIENNEMRHNLHNFNYRPFMPQAPLPPLTFYNGVPLHHYNHPHPNVEFLERDGYPYMGRHPHHKEYVKSKLRRPGRRRGRREIGENEQLGLKQTLRVIATTDFDFVVKDEGTVKPFYVGKSEAQNDVCIAPSSFAAGLGLLLLANICVLCVVVFLGHHYYIHKNMKVKKTELLCTEMT